MFVQLHITNANINEPFVSTVLKALNLSLVLSGAAANVTLRALLTCLRALIKTSSGRRISTERHYAKCWGVLFTRRLCGCMLMLLLSPAWRRASEHKVSRVPVGRCWGAARALERRSCFSKYFQWYHAQKAEPNVPAACRSTSVPPTNSRRKSHCYKQNLNTTHHPHLKIKLLIWQNKLAPQHLPAHRCECEMEMSALHAFGGSFFLFVCFFPIAVVFARYISLIKQLGAAARHKLNSLAPILFCFSFFCQKNRNTRENEHAK